MFRSRLGPSQVVGFGRQCEWAVVFWRPCLPRWPVGRNARARKAANYVAKTRKQQPRQRRALGVELASSRLHVSPRWAALVGVDEHEVGTTPDSWLTKIHPDDLDRVSAALKAQMATNGPNDFDLPHRLRHADGSYRWMSCRGTVQRGAGGKAVRLVGAHADVTADTVMDPVTGLPNRLLLLEHLTRSIERAKRYPGFHFALLVVDLDRAELPTATPARVDDPLLVAAARRLETCLRIGDAASGFRHDDIVARLEGDHFAILVDGLKEVGDATVVAERVLTTLVRPFTTRDHDGFLSPSIGVAVSATGYATADAALRDAETALHRAKLLGKARYEVFDTAILKTAQTELRLEADFAGALDRQEFQVFYQPIVALDGHAIVGFEALARWQHPVLGMVSPLDFIPVAEKTGFILPLGLWILREACRQLKAWQQLPSVRADLWVSVNVSALQFRHEPLFGEIKQVVTRHRPRSPPSGTGAHRRHRGRPAGRGQGRADAVALAGHSHQRRRLWHRPLLPDAAASIPRLIV